MNGKIYKIGDFLLRKKDSITLEDNEKYKRLTIKLYGKGVFLRDIEIGKKIGTKKQFIIREGQFILSKIDARNGAFGVIPIDCDQGIITGNFWSYEINEKIVDINWFNLFVSTNDFIKVCTLASSGATNRKYLNEDKFLNYELFIPNIDEQKRIIEKYSKDKVNFDNLDNIINKNQNYIIQLKQSILQEAIEGKLTKSWRDEKKDIESASVLLEKIKAEKEELIKQKKLKKQKEQKEIYENEIPFDIPNNWNWTRLGTIGQIIGGGTPKTSFNEYFYPNDIPWLTPADLKGNKEKYISNGKRYISNLGLSKSSAQLLPKGTILFSSRAPIGYVRIIKNDLATNQGFKSVVPFSYIFNEYIYYFLLISGKNIDEKATGATFKEVSGTELSRVLIPIPPLEEQKEIVRKVDELMKLCDELEKQIIDIKDNSENLMKAVLGEVFNK